MPIFSLLMKFGRKVVGFNEPEFFSDPFRVSCEVKNDTCFINLPSLRWMPPFIAIKQLPLSKWNVNNKSVEVNQCLCYFHLIAGPQERYCFGCSNHRKFDSV